MSSIFSSLTIHICTPCADYHRHSTCVQVFQRCRCSEVHMMPQELPGLRHLLIGGFWELGCVWIRDWIFFWRWGKGLWHAPTRVSLTLWSSCLGSCSYLGKGLFYLLLFLSSPLSSSLPFRTSHHLRLCVDLLGDCPLTLALSLFSFPMSCFQIVLIPFSFFSPPPPLPSLFPLLHRTILFSFYTSSILPFQHMTDCVINVHHKPLFLLATH